MKIVIAGASGLVGSALAPALRAAGHDIFRLVRGRSAAGLDEIAWEPAAGEIDHARFAGAGAIINLAGENLGAGRWTAARRERILRSRVDATRTLVATVAKAERKSRGEIVLQIEALRDSVSGVSLDEEAANMLKFQRAYEANARFFMTVDSAIDTLINMVGR